MSPFISISRKETCSILLIIVIGFTLRLLCIALLEYGVFSDAAEFKELALNLITGKGFSLGGLPTAYRMPGYPLFLAPLYALFHSDTAVKIIQAVVELSTGVVIFLFAREHIGKKEALTALAIWSFLPVSIFQPLTLMSEGLFTLLFMTLLFCIVGKLSFRRTLLAGIIGGLTVLVKPFMLLFPAVFITWLLLQKYRPKQILLHSALFTGCIILFLVPWIVRNNQVLGAPVLSTNSGQNLYIGNGPEASGSFFDIPADVYPSATDELTIDRYFKQQARAYIAKHPAALLRTIPKKIAYLFSLESPTAIFLHGKGTIVAGISLREAYRATPLPLLAIVNIPYIVLVTGTVFGLLLLTVQFPAMVSLTVVTLFWIAVHCLFFGTARFHYPLLPLFTIATAALLHHRSVFIKSNKLPLAAAMAVATLFCGLWAVELVMIFMG